MKKCNEPKLFFTTMVLLAYAQGKYQVQPLHLKIPIGAISISCLRQHLYISHNIVSETLNLGMFDMFGASHQNFHILIVYAAVVQLIGLLSALNDGYLSNMYACMKSKYSH